MMCVAVDARSQQWPVETVEFSIKWDQAVIAPGETATGGLWISITPDIGTQTQWNTPPYGQGQLGTLAAFATAGFGVTNILNGQTGSLAGHNLPIFTLAGTLPPSPDGQGGLTNTDAGQIGQPLNPSPITDQQIKILDLEWTTTDYTAREVWFEAKPAWAKVYLKDIPGLPIPNQWVGETAVAITMPASTFIVIPAPSMLALVFITPLGRRRSRE